MIYAESFDGEVVCLQAADGKEVCARASRRTWAVPARPAGGTPRAPSWTATA